MVRRQWISNCISLLNRFDASTAARVPEMAVCFTADNEKQLLTLEKRYPQLTLFVHGDWRRTMPNYRKGEWKRANRAVWLHDLIAGEVTDAGWKQLELR